MEQASARMLPDGKRLHLSHGPIDLVLGAEGEGRGDAFRLAEERFQTVLTELVDELPALRAKCRAKQVFSSTIANRMQHAAVLHLPCFITPMAAVAGAVAETVLAAMTSGADLSKAYVNNGGDIAFHLEEGQVMTGAMASETSGLVKIRHDNPVRGIATSGWRGRSHSLGIADSVTVLAEGAARADAAATMIANAVDLPDHPAIRREPAEVLSPDSDLGGKLVTVDVGSLNETDRNQAIEAGVFYAESLVQRGVIEAAHLTLQGEVRIVGSKQVINEKQRELTYA